MSDKVAVLEKGYAFKSGKGKSHQDKYYFILFYLYYLILLHQTIPSLKSVKQIIILLLYRWGN